MNLIRSILCVLLVVAGNAAEPLHVRIDRLIDGGQVGALAGQSSDAEFVRRVYLDFTGRIPSSTAAREFIDNKAADKRTKIIDQLLGSHEYARHMAVSFDVMLMERRADKHVKTPEWRQYLLDSFRANKPWNKIVGEIFKKQRLLKRLSVNTKSRDPTPFSSLFRRLCSDVSNLYFSKFRSWF